MLEPLTDAAEERLGEYLDEIGLILGNKRQRASFAMYAAGLLGEGDRKSAEPIAARVCPDPSKVSALHHRLIHFLASSPWRDAPVREFAARYALQAMEQVEAIETWIADDTGFLKQGKHSVGVQRQYTGSAGKTANCQIGVSLVLANSKSQVPVDFRLYLPQSWAQDPARREQAHIPAEVGYVPKWRLALDMVQSAVRAQLSPGVLLADSGYGNTGAFRDGLTRLGLQYAVEVHSPTVVQRVLHSGKLGVAQSVLKLGRRLKPKVRKVTWREGSRKTLYSRFARVRVSDERPDAPQQWLLIEWPEDEPEPTKFVLSTMPTTVSLKQMVRTFKSRWRVERSYEDLKGQLGLDHFEGRSFGGWHHHVTVALCCYAFLVAEQARAFPPSVCGTCGHGSFSRAA